MKNNLNQGLFNSSYRVRATNIGYQLIEPYQGEILPHWKYTTKEEARYSSIKIYNLFRNYQLDQDFIGMDMCRKFLELGYAGALRIPNCQDCAAIFYRVWQRVERDSTYKNLKKEWISVYE